MPAILSLEEDQTRLMPSLCIEILGILFLLSQWLYPIWLAYRSNSLFFFLFVPAFICYHMLIDSVYFSV
jgi:hypothetical protein